MIMSRVNPFENLDDFSIKPKSGIEKSIEDEKASIDRIAEDNNFPSRQATRKEENTSIIKQQRRYRTGRNQQLNIKATEQTIKKFYRLADKDNVPLGELLDRALNALEKANEEYKS